MIVHDIEQRSPDWYALRAGKPTASAFGDLITPKTMKPSASLLPYAAQLANELFTGESDPDGFIGNGWTDRGEMFEENALAWYEFAHDVSVERVGFVTDDEQTMGCSPDGLVGDDGMIEIKSLKALNHTLALFEFHETGAGPADYRAQTQGQMMICGRKWCDLLFFHDLLPPFVIRQTPDGEYIEKLQAAIQTLLTRRDEILAALRGDTKEKEAA